MVIKIKNYNKEHCYIKYTKNKHSAIEMSNNGINVGYIDESKFIILPSKDKICLCEEEIESLNSLGEGSILEMEMGGAYVCFDTNVNDNALFITNQCNSNCIMCPISEIARQTSKIENIENLIAISELIPNENHHITITGGEPFLLKKNIFILFEYLRNNLTNVEFLLLTNGRALADEKYFNLFKTYRPHKLLVGIPLHGNNAQLHDLITQAPGSFNQSVVAIKRLIKSDIATELRIVVSKLNIDYMQEIAEYIAEELNGIHIVTFIGLEMLGSARKNLEKVWIDYRNAFKGIEKSINLLIKNGIDVQLYNFPLCCVEKEYWLLCKRSISDYKIRYLPECEFCVRKESCGGLFQGTYRLMEGIVEALE